MAQFTLPANSKIKPGKRPRRRRRREERQEVRDLPLRPEHRREPARRHVRRRHGQLRADGSRRADQDQERDRSDADVPPLVPRGHLRLVRDEHRRQEHARVPEADRGRAGARSRSIRCRTCRSSRTSCRISRTFYAQYAAVKPWLESNTPPPPDRERLQSKEDQEKINTPSACILCACCSTSCPSYWWNSRSVPRSGGAAAGLSLDRRQPRRDDGRAARSARGRVPAVSLPHDPELHAGVPEGSEPGQGDRRDQEDDRRAPALAFEPRRAMRSDVARLQVALPARDARARRRAGSRSSTAEGRRRSTTPISPASRRFSSCRIPSCSPTLLGRSAPADADIAALIERIRASHRPYVLSRRASCCVWWLALHGLLLGARDARRRAVAAERARAARRRSCTRVVRRPPPTPTARPGGRDGSCRVAGARGVDGLVLGPRSRLAGSGSGCRLRGRAAPLDILLLVDQLDDAQLAHAAGRARRGRAPGTACLRRAGRRSAGGSALESSRAVLPHGT